MNTEPEFMLETTEFVEVLNDIGEIVSEDFAEDEVQMVFLNEGYFQLLGYERVGTDLRSEYAVPSGFVDYITSGHANTIGDTKTVVYEFKGPQKSLKDHKEQLSGYVDDTGSDFGVLTNGKELMLYENTPTGLEKRLDFHLRAATETEASTIIMTLGYWSIEEQNIKPIAEKTANELVDSLPEEFHIDFSEAGVEMFAEHLARYLKQEFRTENDS